MSVAMLGLVLVYLATGGALLFFSVRVFRFDPSGQMRCRLEGYGTELTATGQAPGDGTEKVIVMRSEMGLWHRYWKRVDGTLAAADLHGKVGTYLTVTVVLVAFPGALAGVMVPRFYVKFRTGRRQRALQGQLADGLGMIAEAVRAGHTFLQGVKMVAREMSPLISVEMQRILDSIQLGRTVESALEEFAARNTSYDIGIAVTAIGVQREVGGNLTETLDLIAETVRERERVRGEVSALTAQGKLSGLVISLIPVGLLLVMSLLNPEYMGALTGTGPGRMLLAVAGAGWLIGFLMIGKITNVRY